MAYPLLFRNLFRHHVESTRDLYGLLGGLLFYPLRARVAGRLLMMLESNGVREGESLMLGIKLTQNDFARLTLGSRQRVNGIFRDWAERGIVESRADRLAVLDLKALKAEAGLE